MVIGTLTTGNGVVSSIPLNYLPQYIYYVAATQLTSLKVNVLGEGTVCDLDSAGLSSVGILLMQSRATNLYKIPLATGFFPGKNVTLNFTNSAAQTPDIFASSNNRGDNGGFYLVSSSQTALASSGVTLKSFLSAHFPNAGATDLYNVEFSDGHTENNLTRLELQDLLGVKQLVTNSASDYMILNNDQTIKKISVVPAATQLVYATQFQLPGTKFLVGNALT